MLSLREQNLKVPLLVRQQSTRLAPCWSPGVGRRSEAQQTTPLRALSSSPQFDPVAAVSQALQALAEAAAGLELSRAQAVGLATLLAAALAAGELRR